MATAAQWANGFRGEQACVNRPFVDTGWRVGMPTGSNPREAEPVQGHNQVARGIIDKHNPWVISIPHPRGGKLVWNRPVVRVWGYGVFGK